MKLPAAFLKKAPSLLGQKIYRRAANGGVLFWQTEVHPTEPMYRALSGQEGGKLKVSAWTTCGAKNEGKANARSPREQAFAQAQMKTEKLLRKGGYHATKDDLDIAKFFSPMAALKYKDVKPKFPVIGQPKFDGGRAVVTDRTITSRYGDNLTVAVPHVLNEVSFHFQRGTLPTGLILDGELYNHDFAGLLNRIMKIIRKKKPDAEDLAFSKANAQYHIYDCYDPARPHLTLEERRMILKKLMVASAALTGKSSCLRFVENKELHTEAEVIAYFRSCLDRKYEGAMIRVPGSIYEPGARTKTLLKFKLRYDAEYPIDRVEEGNGKRKGMAAKVWIRLPNGEKSKVNVKWTDERKIEIWNTRDQLPGTLATVSHAGLTEFGVPFHAYLEKLHYSAKRKI